MKIIETNGCVVSGIEIDGKGLEILEEEEKKQYYQKILNWLSENYSEVTFRELLGFMTSNFGDSKHLYTCDQCGDSVWEYKVEI